MFTTNKLDLPSKYRRQLERFFEKHLPRDVEVLAYGSRLKWDSHPGSDLDLALSAANSKKIPPETLNALRTALRESSIPFLVEVRDLALLPKSFQLEIEKNHVVLFSYQEKIGKKIGLVMRMIIKELQQQKKKKLKREKQRAKQRKLKIQD